MVDGGVDLEVTGAQLDDLIPPQDLEPVNEKLVDDDAHWRGKDPKQLDLEQTQKKRGRKRGNNKKKGQNDEDLGLVARKRKRLVPPFKHVPPLNYDQLMGTSATGEDQLSELDHRLVENQQSIDFLAPTSSQASSSSQATRNGVYDPQNLLRLRIFNKVFFFSLKSLKKIF